MSNKPKYYSIVLEIGPIVEVSKDCEEKNEEVALRLASEHVLNNLPPIGIEIHSISVRPIDPQPKWIAKQETLKERSVI